MQEFYYAQFDSNNICFAVTQTAGELDRPDVVRLDSYDTTLLGKLWQDGEWVDPPTVEEPAA